MNDISINAIQTMSTIEISKLTEDRHDNVCRTAKSLAARLGWALPQFEEKSGGRPIKYFKLDKNQSLTLVARLMPEFLERVIDRWQELEEQVKIPQTYSEALLLASEQARQLEQQQVQLTEQAPKVEFYDAVTQSDDWIDLGQVAKTLNYRNIGRNKLFKFLRENGILQHSGDNRNDPYQRYVNQGYFKIVTTSFKVEEEERSGKKTAVSQRGIEFIKKLLDEDK